MNPRVGVGVFVAFLLAAAGFWWMQPAEAPAPPPPKPSRVLTKLPAPRVYTLSPTLRPKPEPVQVPDDSPQKSLSVDVHRELVSVTNSAMGAGYQGCVAPWIQENPIPDDAHAEPLVVFFDIVDGRLSDIRLRSPLELPEGLVDCFANEVWAEPFPEDPDHRGSVSVQRVITLK